MRAYFNKTWREYILLLLFCTVVPILLGRLIAPPLINNTAYMIWYFLAMPLLCSAMLTMTSKRLGDFDWAAFAVMWLLMLLHAFILNDFTIPTPYLKPLLYVVTFVSFPALETLLLGGIATIVVLHKKRKA